MISVFDRLERKNFSSDSKIVKCTDSSIRASTFTATIAQYRTDFFVYVYLLNNFRNA